MATSAVGLPRINTPYPVSAGLQGALVKSSGSLSDGSARTASTTSGMIDQVQQIAAQNTAASAAQAEQLRKWQELQNAKAMEFNAAEAAKNRDWQKMMSDTAHQREIRDLQAAGLNPVLSAMGGNGASVGSGATASGVTSSGAKGDVDQSASQGLVSLFGTLMNTQTELLRQAMSARSNEAIAAKNNATSQLVAEITGQYGLRRAEVTGEYGLKTAHISGQTARDVQAMKQNHDIYMAQNYPSGLVSAVAAFANLMANQGSSGERGVFDELSHQLAAPQRTQSTMEKLESFGLNRDQAAILTALYNEGLLNKESLSGFGGFINKAAYKAASKSKK